MRLQERNLREFYYSNFIGKKEIIDEWGNRTAQYEMIRSAPKVAIGNISGSFGDTQTQHFGGDLNYDKKIVLKDYDVPIDEYSILWVDKDPQLDEGGKAKVNHDYIVTKVSKTINFFVIGIKKVDVNEN